LPKILSVLLRVAGWRCFQGDFLSVSLPRPEGLGYSLFALRAIGRGDLVRPLDCLFLCLSLSLLGCANVSQVANRDFAFDTYYPTPNEVQLAQQRAQRYWQKNAQRFGNSTPYLAVYAANIVQADINQDLYSKLINSDTTASYFSTGSELQASCIMIYDIATNKFVSNAGYASVDLPPRGSVARWDGYTARYIGWGG
jgi:hypothetical protein